jgi:hypothetical protein
MPKPKAQPLYWVVSRLCFSRTLRTLGWTMPQPPSSIQRFLSGNQTSTSAEGSVKGKKLGRKRILVSWPK